MDNTEITELLNKLDTEVKEIKNSLNSCVTVNDMKEESESIYKVLLKQMKNDFNDFVDNATNQISSTFNKDLYYTKEDIDNKNFLTQHQSLSDYVTLSYLKNNYLRINDANNLMSINYVKKSTLNETLESYITSKTLEDSLNDYVTKDYLDTQISNIENKIGDNSEYTTKTYVNNALLKLTQNIYNQYSTKTQLNETYLTKDEQKEFSDTIEDIYLKKSDFNSSGFLTIDILDEYAKITDLNNYAYKDDVESITSTLNNVNSLTLFNSKKINSISSKLNGIYTKDEILSNYITKEDIESKYLTKSYASKNYLSLLTAQESYLTKHEAKITYLAIEDYKSLKKNSLIISDTYKYNETLYNSKLSSGELTNGIYIVGDSFYVVMNNISTSGSNKMTWTYTNEY